MLHKVARLLPPEMAHQMALYGLSTGVINLKKYLHQIDQCLKVEVLDLSFKSPLGLAAGFDKNALCAKSLLNTGFGFVEFGTVTRYPQLGNKKPRVWRFPRERALVNKLGFNNLGVDVLCQRIAAVQNREAVLGINIGRSRYSHHEIMDYIQLIDAVYLLADYIVLNISSPNTPGLRALHQREKLDFLLLEVRELLSQKFRKHRKKVQILVKIAPDLTKDQQTSVMELVIKHGVNGVVIGNTSAEHMHTKELGGGLSGAPLFKRSNEVLKHCYLASEGRVPLIGTGGVMSAYDLYKKIKLGASLVQIYTGIVYQGFKIIHDIHLTLPLLLKRDGFRCISDAIGAESGLYS